MIATGLIYIGAALSFTFSVGFMVVSFMVRDDAVFSRRAAAASLVCFGCAFIIAHFGGI